MKRANTQLCSRWQRFYVFAFFRRIAVKGGEKQWASKRRDFYEQSTHFPMASFLLKASMLMPLMWCHGRT